MEEEKNMRFLSKIFLIVLISHLSQAFLFAQVQTAVVKAIDAKATYRLSNDYTGPSKFLTISENDVDLNMVDATRSPKQLWKFVPEDDGKFRMVNMSDEEKYLDVTKRSDVYAVVMAEPGDRSEQTWSFVTQKDGKLRFLNTFAGDNRSLDVYKNGDVYSVVVGYTGDYSGQAWTLTKVTK